METTSSTKDFRKHEKICELLGLPVTCPHCGEILDDRDNSGRLHTETDKDKT